MDVVSQTGPVRSRIVGSKDFHFMPAACRCIEDKRDQMCLRVVILPEIAIAVRPCGIEVSERQVFQTVGLMEPWQCAFEGKLRIRSQEHTAELHSHSFIL